YTNTFNDIAHSLVALAKGRPMVFDGEMVVTDDDGKSNFQALQAYLNNQGSKTPTYIIFDLLALDGEDLRDQPLVKRKKILKGLLKDSPSNLYYSDHIVGNGKENFDAACESNLEGVIGKKADSVYSANGDGTWIKLKCNKRQEFIIGGYTLTDKRKEGISALLLGLYKSRDFVYVGRAGTGINEDEMDLLLKKFKSLTRKKSYFKEAPKERSNEKITWLKPDLIAEIKFSEWTDDNLLRQASYKGLRLDKNPSDVIMEKADVGLDSNPKDLQIDIEITHPEKILYDQSEITKLDVAEYYENISDAMVPYLKNRILSVVRCPKGISEACFFLKHPNTKNKNISRIVIDTKNEENAEYFYIKNKSGILYEVQMGTLEFHTWASSVETLEKPDIMVFDLDPDEGMNLDRVRQGVKHLKAILDELSLKSYLKTSGGKGYHVVVPLKANVSWDEFRNFAKSIAEIMEEKWPDSYTSNMRKGNRKNKIFIDWIRNGRGATSVTPYSIRARKGAKVSMPISWDELDKIAPDDIDMQEAIARFKVDDPWKDFFEIKQMLS
ncbi:MAG: DNA ligase D, partial [Tissierellia bacterium]|nr:DNA ligase D [Tissierellia bacterium]